MGPWPPGGPIGRPGAWGNCGNMRWGAAAWGARWGGRGAAAAGGAPGRWTLETEMESLRSSSWAETLLGEGVSSSSPGLLMLNPSFFSADFSFCILVTLMLGPTSRGVVALLPSPSFMGDFSGVPASSAGFFFFLMSDTLIPLARSLLAMSSESARSAAASSAMSPAASTASEVLSVFSSSSLALFSSSAAFSSLSALSASLGWKGKMKH